MYIKTFLVIVFLSFFFQSESQVNLDFSIGGHVSKFDGFYEESSMFSYLKSAFPIYSRIDRQLYFGKVVDQEKIQHGFNFSLGISKKIGKKTLLGLSLAHYGFKTKQWRDQGLTDFYPFKWGYFPDGIQIIEKYTFKNNLLVISPLIQYNPFKKIGLFVSPSLFFNNAKYETRFFVITSDSTGAGQGYYAKNPDKNKTGLLVKGGIIYYPTENIGFAIEHLRTLSAVNKESQIVKNTYTSWSAKIMFSLKILK